MSRRYKGAIISATPPTTSTTSATGEWTLQSQAQAQGAGTWPAPPNYIEDVFSTWLYTGNNDINTITNGIDLSTKGGLVWLKDRTTGGAVYDHVLYDTVRGVRAAISSDSTSAQQTAPAGYELTNFNTTGFTLNTNGYNYIINGYGSPYVSWTFRKQPKFFDVVTYTGNSTNRTIAHNLGSVPGCIIVKSTTQTSNWQVYHRGLTSAAYGIQLNDTAAQASFPTFWNSTAPTSTEFSIGTSSSVNLSGESFVAYIFAHDAGGFGLAGTDNVITCGSYSSDGSGNVANVNLGYEPQWLLTKKRNSTDNWVVIDNMRGLPATSASAVLRPNTTDAEFAGGTYNISATGFNPTGTAGLNNTYIYIAIRRGPMKVPTDATKVFLPSSFTGSNTVDKVISTNFTVDMTWGRTSNIGGNNWEDFDRLRGAVPRLNLNATTAEVSAQASNFDVSNGITLLAGYDLNYSTYNFINYTFARAPSFFDEVCYTGTGSATTVAHNLGVVPELIIVKIRNNLGSWNTYNATTGNGYQLQLNFDTASGGSNAWNSTTPTSTVFSVGAGGNGTNDSAKTYVAYLFATCAGVSKVGSYTGTGATQTINCGFTGGARFVLVKRTDSTGDWYVWDTARGMVSGTDPSLLLNSTAAEVNANSIYTATTGFQIVSTAAGINASGGTYIYLAIA